MTWHCLEVEINGADRGGSAARKGERQLSVLAGRAHGMVTALYRRRNNGVTGGDGAGVRTPNIRTEYQGPAWQFGHSEPWMWASFYLVEDRPPSPLHQDHDAAYGKK